MDLRREQDSSLLSDWRERALALERALSEVVIGQARVIRLLTIAVFTRGHVLLEGDVGVGKTTLLRAMARAIGGRFERIEGTVDLMPADLLYHARLDEAGKPRVDPGPLVRQGGELAVFFFNEINRARPQVHSLLLRLMAERSVTAFNREIRFPHLQVFADRNQVEREETFELPAAARDRFLMEVSMATPEDESLQRSLAYDTRFHDSDLLIESIPGGVVDHSQLGRIASLIQGSIRASDAIQSYTTALWAAVRTPHRKGIRLEEVETSRLVMGGPSPRGISYLVRAARVRAWLEGRDMLIPEDLREVFNEVVAHRIFVDPVYEMRGAALVRQLCGEAFRTVPAP
jgi:MoxR-like ATPase